MCYNVNVYLGCIIMYKYFFLVSALIIFVSGFSNPIPYNYQLDDSLAARGGGVRGSGNVGPGRAGAGIDRPGSGRDIQHPYGAAAVYGYNRGYADSGSYYDYYPSYYQSVPQNPYMMPQQPQQPYKVPQQAQQPHHSYVIPQQPQHQQPQNSYMVPQKPTGPNPYQYQYELPQKQPPLTPTNTKGKLLILKGTL